MRRVEFRRLKEEFGIYKSNPFAKDVFKTPRYNATSALNHNPDLGLR